MYNTAKTQQQNGLPSGLIDQKDFKSAQKKVIKRGSSKNFEIHIGGNTPTSAGGNFNYKKALKIGKIKNKDEFVK